MKGNSIGPPIDIRGFETREGTLRFITDDAVNTGLFYCVDALDESVVFDEFVILTESECGVLAVGPCYWLSLLEFETYGYEWRW